MEKFSNSIDEKQKKWQEQASLIERTIDGLGMYLDQNIKEPVIALNLLGVHTNASCEGHLDNGIFDAPYIDIEAKETQDMRIKVKGISDDTEHMKILLEIRKNNLEERKKIVSLVNEFYSQRQSKPMVKLGIRDTELGWSRLESAGAELQENESQEIKKERLLEFQNEMKAFSEFLKKKFFEK